MKPILLHILYFMLLNLAVVLLGYIILKKKAVLQSWIMLIAGILVIYLIFLHDNPIVKMLAIIATTFTCMKVIAVTENYKNKALSLKFNQWFIFAVAWAGMRAEPFEKLGEKPLPNAWPMIRFGITRVIIGFLFILLAHGIVLMHLSYDLTYTLVSAVLLIGFSLILHFGLLSISAGMWRFSGVNTYFLFKEPAEATSLAEFWSKRWNLAFSEMTSITIFRPLRNKTGGAIALMLAFMFSGLLHELALSVPVNSGYCLPLLYFIIQGALVLIEKALSSHNILFLKNKIIARLWVFFWLVAPMPLLFHTEFIKQIVWPLAGIKL
jgi:hypothetical protein